MCNLYIQNENSTLRRERERAARVWEMNANYELFHTYVIHSRNMAFHSGSYIYIFFSSRSFAVIRARSQANIHPMYAWDNSCYTAAYMQVCRFANFIWNSTPGSWLRFIRKTMYVRECGKAKPQIEKKIENMMTIINYSFGKTEFRTRIVRASVGNTWHSNHGIFCGNASKRLCMAKYGRTFVRDTVSFSGLTWTLVTSISHVLVVVVVVVMLIVLKWLLFHGFVFQQ